MHERGFYEIWSDKNPTSFKIGHKVCENDLVLNHLGECEAKRVTCSDISMKFYEDKDLKPCEVRIDGYIMNCFAKYILSECAEETTNSLDVCATYESFLAPAGPQLIQFYFNFASNFQQKICEPREPAP